ncbi:MAG: hypothetical protein ACREH9_12915, partial [Pseudomonadota bacterium]
AEVDELLKKALERGVLLETCAAAGAPDDTAKADAVFKSASPAVSRPAFILAMANDLFAQSEIFSDKKLQQTDKEKIFCDRALAALKSVPETQYSKELTAKIRAALKKINIS